MRRANLKVVNLRPSVEGGVHWEEVIFVMVEKLMDVEEDAPVGYTWMMMMMLVKEEAQQVGSWSTEAGLDIKDIVWPNESRVPPKVSTN